MCISRSTSVHATTVTGKTPSLTVVQMIVDSLHEDVTPHKVIAKKPGCSVLYQSISMKRWTGREECLHKSAFTRVSSPLKKSFTTSGPRLESEHQKPPHVDLFRIKATTVKFLKSCHSWNNGKHQMHLTSTWFKEKKKWTVAQWSRFSFDFN